MEKEDKRAGGRLAKLIVFYRVHRLRLGFAGLCLLVLLWIEFSSCDAVCKGARVQYFHLAGWKQLISNGPVLTPEITAKALGLDLDIVCNRTVRFGLGTRDGGWATCLDIFDFTQMNGKRRVVYSFGMAEDAPFDMTLTHIGFEVWSFDPSTHYFPGESGPNHNFNCIGLASVDGSCRGINTAAFLPGCSCRSLQSLMKERGHTKIDILKLDIEHAEWRVLHGLLKSGELAGMVDQLLLEIHFSVHVHTHEFELGILSAIKAAGFRLFHREDNWLHSPWIRIRGLLSRRSYELGFIRLPGS